MSSTPELPPSDQLLNCRLHLTVGNAARASSIQAERQRGVAGNLGNEPADQLLDFILKGRHLWFSSLSHPDPPLVRPANELASTSRTPGRAKPGEGKPRLVTPCSAGVARASFLDCDVETLHHLRLCWPPRPERWEWDMEELNGLAGVERSRPEELLAE
jgi:hypothetical protein